MTGRGKSCKEIKEDRKRICAITYGSRVHGSVKFNDIVYKTSASNALLHNMQSRVKNIAEPNFQACQHKFDECVRQGKRPEVASLIQFDTATR